jgi:hypothetical protein
MTTDASARPAIVGLNGFINTDIARSIGRGTWLAFPVAPVTPWKASTT